MYHSRAKPYFLYFMARFQPSPESVRAIVSTIRTISLLACDEEHEQEENFPKGTHINPKSLFADLIR